MGQDRRGFLKSGAAAALAISPFTSKMCCASDKVNIAFIGVGLEGSSNLGFAASTPGVNVAAVSGDFRDVLADKSIDAVCIATSADSQARIAIQACKAGKDVWVETPACLSIEEGGKVVEAARKYRRVVQAGTVHRSSGVFREAREIVKSGKLGDITFCRVFQPRADSGVNLMDIVQFIFDDAMPLSVTAQASNPETILAIYRYPCFIVSYESRAADGNSGIVLHGTKATLRLNLGVYNPNMNMAHWANFVECIHTRQKPASDIETYVRSTTTCMLANLACRHSSAVTWDDKTFTWKREV